jgi:hypothetical protein
LINQHFFVDLGNLVWKHACIRNNLDILNQTSLPRLLYPKRIDRRLHKDRLIHLFGSRCKQFSVPRSESDFFYDLVFVGVTRVMTSPNRVSPLGSAHATWQLRIRSELQKSVPQHMDVQKINKNHSSIVQSINTMAGRTGARTQVPGILEST